jgi:hypothetical protein
METGISKSSLVQALQRAKSTMANARAEGRKMTSRGINSGLTIGSAFGAATLRKNYGEGAEKRLVIPGTDVDSDLALGLAGVALGVVGLADDYSDPLAAAGSGLLSCFVTAKVLLG